MRSKTERLLMDTPGVLTALGLLLVFASTASAASTTLSFEEVEKGSTFAFVDNPPKTTLEHGFPKRISAGDQFVSTNPLRSAGKPFGRLLTSCTATKSSKIFDDAGLTCAGTFVFSNGTLTASAIIDNQSSTEGAVTGGTGAYANARGTFVSREGKGTSAVTVTLVE